MEFHAVRVRKAGRVQPKHVIWVGQVTGELSVREAQDAELGRAVRAARLTDAGGRDLLPPLLDATLVAVRRGWWTMTGWERGDLADALAEVAYQQSWILVPVGEADG